MSAAYLDTQVSVWLHAGLTSKLTNAAKREIEKNELLISPMVYLEFHYLFQRKRIRTDAPTIYADLNGTFGVALCTLSFPAIAVLAVDCQWTNDPFDRIIVANAWANQESKLITSDEAMREHYRRAVW